MDKRSKILIVVFLICVFISVAETYYRTMVIKDFEVIETEIIETEVIENTE